MELAFIPHYIFHIYNTIFNFVLTFSLSNFYYLYNSSVANQNLEKVEIMQS